MEAHTINNLQEVIESFIPMMRISFFILSLLFFINMGWWLYKKSLGQDVDVYKNPIDNKKQSNNQNVSSNENQENANLSINLDMQQPKKTLFRPNVDNILSMIQYIEDLQEQIKNSSNINKRNKIALSSALQSPLSNIDQSIFVKFNILKENFTLDYQAVDWGNNINQEISNSYQKIYDEHEKLLQEQYENIKQYLKEYFDDQVLQSKKELDLIKKIIN